jgi:transposase-like protein
MKRTHRKFTHVFKTEVVLEALKERFTLPELAKKLYLQPNQIQLWKKAFLSKATSVFDQDNQLEEQQKQTEDMLMEIGRLRMENAYLKKSFYDTISPKKINDRRAFVNEW